MSKKIKRTKDELLEALKIMMLSRAIDEKVSVLIRQGKASFLIAGAGHEAAQVAFGKRLKSKYDWAYPYYRDQAVLLSLGVTPEDIMLEMLGKADDPANGGRQMGNHWGHKDFNIPSQSSPTGTQFLQAVGTALGYRKIGENRIVYVSAGDGTTSQGEFHEAINWASREKLPVIFMIENNGWAISVPVEDQTAGKNASITEMMKGYENLLRISTDGTDYENMLDVADKAYEYAESGKGPVLIEAKVVRLFSHSSSDDQAKYRSKDSLEADLKKDPIELLKKKLVADKIISNDEFENLKHEIKLRVDDVADWALAQPDPVAETAARYVYDESGLKDTFEYEKSVPAGNKIVMVDAINHAMHEEMERNEKIFVFGEDIADGKGGVFTATKGLSTKFGNDRVFNSPLAEASIEGVATGMALAGLKPCVEIQFGDYIWPAFMQLRDEQATYRYRSNNAWPAPVVTRVPVGGFIGGGLYHSQTIEGFFAHLPGIYIAYPSNAADAKGLLKTALRLNDPVLYLEHKALYRQTYAASPEPDADYLLPFGKANVVREGTDLTVVTWGAMVHESNFAAKKLEKEGLSIEIIDIRTINPLDEETIYNSIKKTGKVSVVHEDTLTAGFGAEIAARIASNAFELLDGPVQRIAARDAFIPYHPNLERYILPTRDRIYDELKELLAY
jgi:2-oxoisovalerate dehydrogenase E1 component